MTTTGARRKRPHPACRARQIAGSISIAALLALTGCMAATTKTATASRHHRRRADDLLHIRSLDDRDVDNDNDRGLERDFEPVERRHRSCRALRRPNPTPRPMPVERRFRAMGSDAHVIVVGGPKSLALEAEHRIADLEQRWSRFDPHSEVRTLTRDAGSPVIVSAETLELVERALAAWRLTNGIFDPTILGPLTRAGYDRSFDDLAPMIENGTSDLTTGAGEITIVGNTVQLPRNTGFDPGGIGKGLAADIVVDELRAEGAEGSASTSAETYVSTGRARRAARGPLRSSTRSRRTRCRASASPTARSRLPRRCAGLGGSAPSAVITSSTPRPEGPRRAT